MFFALLRPAAGCLCLASLAGCFVAEPPRD